MSRKSRIIPLRPTKKPARFQYEPRVSKSYQPNPAELALIRQNGMTVEGFLKACGNISPKQALRKAQSGIQLKVAIRNLKLQDAVAV